MSGLVHETEQVRAVEEEGVLEFIAGFPCTRFGCHRKLEKDSHRGRIAIVCPGCDHVHYTLADR